MVKISSKSTGKPKPKKTKTDTKKRVTPTGTCHSCLENFKYKELFSVTKDGGGLIYTILMCEKCCTETGVSGELYSDLLKERRKHTSEIFLGGKKDE